jgi:transposase
MTTIGIDLGDRHSHFCVLDEAGEVLEEGRLTTTSAALRRRFAAMPPTWIAMEVGTHSPWVSQLLLEAGHEVIVANSRKLRMIFTNESKNDRLDSEQLARVARLDPKLLHPIEHRGRPARADLAILRSRDCLVSVRTRLVNHVHGVTKAFGARLKKHSAPGFHRLVADELPEELLPALQPVLDSLADLSQRIKAYEVHLEELARTKYPETEVLRQVCGVGLITALCFVLTLEEPTRIKRSRMVGAFLGLRPKQRQSGRRDPELRITKVGDRDLRKLLVQSAQRILGPFGADSDLRRWGLTLAARGGKNAKKRAVVAVARKLAVLLHRLWVTGATYEPLRNSQARERREPAAAAG